MNSAPDNDPFARLNATHTHERDPNGTAVTERLTTSMIGKLRDEAGAYGDTDLHASCIAALQGDNVSRCEVAKAINGARALDDSCPFVRVVP